MATPPELMAVDALESRSGMVALHRAISEDPLMLSDDVASAVKARIERHAAIGDQAAADRLADIGLLLEESRAIGLPAAFGRYFVRNEILVTPELQEWYSAYGAAALNDDRGVSELRACPPNYLPIVQEMLERQIVGLMLQDDLFRHRLLEERLEFLRAYVSGSPPPPSTFQPRTQRLVLDRDEPEIAALYSEAKQSAQRFLQNGDTQGIDDALALLEAAGQHPRWNDASQALREEIREGRASLLATRYRVVSGREEDIASAIEVWTDLASTSGNTEIVTKAITNCSMALVWQGERVGIAGSIDQSIELLETIASGSVNGVASANLASLALRRFEARGHVSDLELAGLAASDAIAYSEIGDRTLPMALHTLSNVFSHRYAQSKTLRHVELAVRYARDSVWLLDGLAFDAAQLARSLNSLGAHLQQLHEATDEPSALDEAIEVLERAQSMTIPGTVSHIHATVDLAMALSATSGSDPRALARVDHAIALLRDLDAVGGAGRNGHAFAAATLAGSLFDRWRLTRDTQSREEAFAIWKAVSGTEVAARDISSSLVAARNLGTFALEAGDWATAAESLSRAVALIEELVMRNVVRRYRDATLSQTYGVAALAAYALVRQEKPAEAAMMLERGRAFSLSFALATGDQAVRRLAEAGRGDLGVDLERVGSALGFAELADDAGATANAATDLRRVLDEVRGLSGFEDFLSLPTPERVLSDPGLPIVYVAATAFGGIAVLLGAQGRADALTLPDLTEERLVSFVRSLYGTVPSANLNTALQMDLLDEILSWLWTSCMGPVLALLGGEREAVLVPSGYLGVVPLQAAWHVEQGGNGTRDYVLDRTALVFAPNGRAHKACASRAVANYQGAPLLVGDPQPSRQRRLRAAHAEVLEASALLPGSVVITEEAASADFILATLDGRRLFHFAGHAYSDQNAPLESFLLTADDQPLTARNIVASGPKRIRLVVLSACETAVPDFRHVDEVVSLATALIQAGAAGVIASQWAVNDAATMILAIEFYRRWQNGAVAPHHALASAQQWMHSSAPSAKRDAYAPILESIGISVPEGDWPHFAEPLYWAAFSYWGA